MNKQLIFVFLLLLFGFTTAAYKCVANTNGCQTCGGTANDQCSTCKSGWYLDATTKVCAVCSLTGCAECTDKATCKTPASQYTMFQGQLVKCDEGCNKCTATSATEKTCSEAAAGYSLDKNNALIKCIDKCLKCTEAQKFEACTQAVDGYFLDIGIGRCSDANCIKCEDDRTICKDCPLKFALVNNACEACMENCQKCDSKAICTTCVSGFKYDSGNKKCVPCMTGCRKCDADVSACEECNTGYSYKDSKCVQCSTNCLSCATNGDQKCDEGQCAPTFFYNLQQCQPNCGVPNCKTCDTTYGRCKVCNTQYGLTSAKQCAACDTNCASTCDSKGQDTCDSNGCKEGYGLDTNSKCIECKTKIANCLSCTVGSSSNSCSKCEERYVATSDKSQCVPCFKESDLTTGETVSGYDEFAQTCSISTAQLTIDTCKEGYTLQNQKCYSCKNLKYFFSTDEADFYQDKKVINCEIQNPIRVQTCKSGYYVDKTTNTCKDCPSNCATCSSGTTCIQCKTGKVLNSSTGGCDDFPGCVESSGGQCTKCDTYYLLLDDKSACTNVANCLEFDGSDQAAIKCTKCDVDNKVKSDGTCETSTGCASTKLSDNSCDGCKTGYYLDTTCKTKAGCATYDSTFNCLTCLPDYYYKSSDKSCQSSTGCSKSSGTACNGCRDTYYLDGTECKACTTGCTKCSSADSCSACTPITYVLFGGKCRKVVDLKVKNDDTVLQTATYDANAATVKGSYGVISKKCDGAFPNPDLQICLDCSGSNEFYTDLAKVTPQGQSECTECSYSDSTIKCSKCTEKFAAIAGSCSSCDTNCNNGQCTEASKCKSGQCKSKFGLNASNGCSGCIQNCANCNISGNTICDQCENGFYATGDKKKCVSCQTFLNCAKCSTGDSCESCKAGFYPFSSTECRPCYSDKCATCSGPSLSQCVPLSGWGKYFPKGEPISSSSKIKAINPCSSSNCKECFGSASSDCLTPVDKYFIESGELKKCPDGCASCLGSTLDKCTLADGFYKDTTANPVVIKPCPAGCKTCTVSGTAAAPVITCSACLTDWTFDPSSTTTKVCFQNCIANCEKCTTQDVNGCSACKTGFNKGTTGCSTSGTTTSGTSGDTTSNASLISTLFATLLVALILLF